MHVEVVLLPADLSERQSRGRSIVIFDVFRATTTMTAALAAGVREIHVFGSTDAAVSASNMARSTALLCGEEKCLPPSGFHLGNSPGVFTPELHCDRIILMSTTNGTRAILAAQSAAKVLIGALVNARAVAQALSRDAGHVTLLCAGTGGQVAIEDLAGAGAVIVEIKKLTAVEAESDAVLLAESVFAANRENLPQFLREGRGGQNVIAAGLEADIAFAATLNSIDLVGIVMRGKPPIVRKLLDGPNGESQLASYD